MKDAAVSSESKMDANKKHEITFEDDSDTGSKFAYKASFFFLVAYLSSYHEKAIRALYQLA